jgi:hypothetical protein
LAATLKGFSVDTVGLSKNIKILIILTWVNMPPERSFSLSFNAFSLSLIINHQYHDSRKYRFHLLKKKITHHLANESISARKPIASPAESRKSSFENVELSRKSVKISSKDSVRRRLGGNVRATASAVRRQIVGGLYMIA